MNTNQRYEQVKLTIGGLVRLHEDKKVNSDLTCQRKYVTHWTKQDVINNLKDSILRGWHIQPLHVIIARDAEGGIARIDLIDGKQRESVIFAIASDPSLTSEEKVILANYELELIDHAGESMDESAMSEYFSRLNGGGKPLTPMEILRGKFAGTLAVLPCKEIATATGITVAEAEKLVVYVAAHVAGLHDWTQKAITWFSTNQTVALKIDWQVLAARLAEINLPAKARKLIHAASIAAALVDFEPYDANRIHANLDQFFSFEDGKSSDLKKQYSSHAREATGSAVAVEARIKILKSVFVRLPKPPATAIVTEIKAEEKAKQESPVFTGAIATIPTMTVDSSVIAQADTERTKKEQEIIAKDKKAKETANARGKQNPSLPPA